MASEENLAVTKTEDGERLLAVTRAVDEVMAENETLKARITFLEKQLEEQTKLLVQANDFIANQKRAEIILEVKKLYDVGDEFIASRKTEELKEMVEMARLKKPPRFKSSGDLSTDDPVDLLHSMYAFGKKRE